MPVISPRRSSTSASGSFYRTTPGASSSSGTSGYGGSGSSNSSITSSYLDRAESLTKTTPSTYSSYNSFLNSYSPSSYTPRTPTYRSSYTSPVSSCLSGGSSGLGTYRRTSYLEPTNNSSSSSSYDASSSSRYGLNKKPPIADTLRRVETNESDKHRRKPPLPVDSGNSSNSSSSSKRLSGSLSSSSLARLVATSGLDLYEKYSPAHYKPNSELSTSSSRSSLIDNADSSNNITSSTSNNNSDETTTHFTLDRPRSRYSRLYSTESPSTSSYNGNSKLNNQSDNDVVDYSSTRSRSSSRRGTGKLLNSSSGQSISQSNSSNDVPTATFTLRSNRFSVKAKDSEKDGEPNVVVKNGTSTNDLELVRNQLKELKCSNSNDESKNDEDNSHATKNGNSADVEVSVTATLKSEENVNGTLNKSNSFNSKMRGTTTRTALPSAPHTPTSSRYYDRGSNRTASYATSSAYSSNNTSSNNVDADASSSLNSDDDNGQGLVGLRNIGNTCFMNSIIQCLSHTTELTKFLRQHDGSLARSTAKDQHILNEFAKLIRDMWTGGHATVTPMELKRAFSVKHRMYSDYNQQDAQEFLRFFLDSLHGAMNSGVKGEPLKIDDNLSDNKKAELTWEWYTRHENSLIRDLFVGQLKSTLRCTTCGNTSVTFDPFWDLSVPLPSSSRCKLDACLEFFIREEILDGDEMPTCARCKTRRKCTKSLSIQRFPKYLVIHLKRFSETRWSKLSNVVEFPTEERELNMGPYGSNPNTNMYYSLYAISNHMGSTAGGHYVAVCKHPNTRRWHEFNDNIVQTADKAHLVTSSAYILFYERA